MHYAGILLGMMGFCLGIGAYCRLDKLEKKLKEKHILDEDWKSE